MKLAYKLDKNWAPYGEVGNVGVNDRSDRQTRFRVGVALQLLIKPSSVMTPEPLAGVFCCCRPAARP